MGEQHQIKEQTEFGIRWPALSNLINQWINMATWCLCPVVFVEFESLAHIVISLVAECIFPVYLYSLCRCIPCLTQRHRHFRLCIWAKGWYRQRSKGRGSWIKDARAKLPHQTTNTPPAGVDQAKCVGPRRNKRALFLASRTHGGWESHWWLRVKGQVADYGRRKPPGLGGTEHC